MTTIVLFVFYAYWFCLIAFANNVIVLTCYQRKKHYRKDEPKVNPTISFFLPHTVVLPC